MEIKTIQQLDDLFQAENGQPFPIPISGSLGLLALGDLGIQAWRLKIKLIKNIQFWLNREKYIKTIDLFQDR